MMFRCFVIFLDIASLLAIYVEAMPDTNDELIDESCGTLHIETASHGKFC